jgi:hypothetical protein
MKEIFDNILKSFNNREEGYSSRKLTAFVITILVVIIHIKWIALGDFTHLDMVLTIDYGFIAALFGMTTYHSIKKIKTNKADDTKK